MKNVLEEKPKYSVPNLERSFIIMENLGKSQEGLTLTELVNVTGFPQNSIFRICRTLCELGYLNRNTHTKRYQLTQRIFNLALGAVSPGGDILKEAAPKLQKVAQETGETCCLGTMTEGKGVVLAVSEGTRAFRFHIDLGASFYLHTSAPGKAMLAGLSDPAVVVRELDLPYFTERTITEKEAFLGHLKEVRRCGYAVDQEEEMVGQHCIGAAINIPQSHVPCALWITAPSSRLPVEDFPRVGNYLRALCEEIELKLSL